MLQWNGRKQYKINSLIQPTGPSESERSPAIKPRHLHFSLYFLSNSPSYLDPLFSRYWIFQGWSSVCVYRHSVVSDACDPMDCTPGSSYLWNTPGKNTRVGCHPPLGWSSNPGTEPTSPAFPALQADSLPLGKPDWVWSPYNVFPIASFHFAAF